MKPDPLSDLVPLAMIMAVPGKAAKAFRTLGLDPP